MLYHSMPLFWLSVKNTAELILGALAIWFGHFSADRQEEYSRASQLSKGKLKEGEPEGAPALIVTMTYFLQMFKKGEPT